MNKHAAFSPASRDELAWLGTDPIPSKPYYDPGYFELEREAVFRCSWLHVGHVCDVPEPGSFIRREIEVLSASLLLVRGRDGEIRAFYNVCTHRGTQLVDEEKGEASKFSCRYHMWTFGTDGRLLSAPDFERFYTDKASCALKQVAVEVCGGLIFVNFAKDPGSMREELGQLADRLEALPVARATTFTEYVYEIEANWKLVYDNFQENYHLRFIHPQSAGEGIGADNPFGYAAGFGFSGKHRTQAIWVNLDPPAPTWTKSLAYRRFAQSAQRKGLPTSMGNPDYFALYPNFFLFGSATSPFSHTVYPIAADRSRGVFRLYWVGDDLDASERFAREYMMASVRDVHSEDRDVIIAGQKGLSSGALTHINFQTQEALCRHFFNTVNAAVEAYKAERV